MLICDLAEGHEDLLGPQCIAHRNQAWLSAQPSRHQCHRGKEHHPHGTQAAPDPTHRSRKFDIRSEFSCYRFDADAFFYFRLDGDDDLFDFVERPAKTARQTVGQ